MQDGNRLSRFFLNYFKHLGNRYGKRTESPAKKLTFLLLIVPYQMPYEWKKRKKGGGFFSNVSCEETFLNNSNPTAHVHCKILSIRTNQTHLHLPSFFQLREFRFSNILLSKYLERLFRRKKKEREKKRRKKLQIHFLLFPPFLSKDHEIWRKIFPLSSIQYRHILFAKNLEHSPQLARISGTRLLSRVREFNSQVFFT